MYSVSYAELIRRNRDFRYFWGGQIVSQLGDWFSAITLQAMLLQYTGEASSLAWFMVASMLPGMLLGPVAGIYVDRLPRKAVMIGADLIRMGIALGFLLMGPHTIWIGYVCQAGLSALAAFFEPARIATLPNITSDEELVTANALSSVTWSILLTSGALVGGIIGHFFGPAVAFILNSVSFAGSALLLSQMHVPPTHRERQEKHGFGELAAGFRYVRDHPEIGGALTAKMGWGLAGGMQVLIPIFGQRLFPLTKDPGGQLSISILFAFGGLGTALGPIIGRRLTGRDPHRIRWAIASAFLIAGLFYIAMAAAKNLWLVGALLLAARMNGAVVWVFSTVLLQILVRDQFRGRVFAAETSLFTAMMMASSIVTTRALDHLGISVGTACIALGVISIAVGLVWVVRMATGRVPDLPTAGPEPEREEVLES